MPLFCKACGEQVRVHELREHQQGHDGAAETLSWEQIRSCYEIKKQEKEVI